jgi:hypothetical protein
MAAKQVPLFSYGDFTKKVYIVTRWRKGANGVYHALEKHDVTEDFKTFAKRMRDEGII